MNMIDYCSHKVCMLGKKNILMKEKRDISSNKNSYTYQTLSPMWNGNIIISNICFGIEKQNAKQFTSSSISIQILKQFVKNYL